MAAQGLEDALQAEQSALYARWCFFVTETLMCCHASLGGAKNAKVQAKGDDDEDAMSGNEGEGEEEEGKEVDPELELEDSKWNASKHSWPILGALSDGKAVIPGTSTDQNVRVVPHWSADISWAERFGGALFYDNVNVKEPPATAGQDFKAFYEGGKASNVIIGACRNKVEAGHASFARGFESRDWTSVDERWLRASFWGCQQLESDSDAFFAEVEQVDKRLLQGVTKLAARRHQAAKPEHSQVGIMAARSSSHVLPFV